jgi:hypothetical protein
MSRRVTLIAAIVMSICSFALYQTELGVRRQEKQLAEIDRQIDEHRRALRVLRAEWAYLSQPTRLQDLTFQHLDLMPVSGAQVAALDDLPTAERDLIPDYNVGNETSERPTWPGSSEALPLPQHRPVAIGGLPVTIRGARR